MKILKNIAKSMLCTCLIASLSVPIVYAFDGLLGGGGLAQVTQDLKNLVPERTSGTVIPVKQPKKALLDKKKDSVSIQHAIEQDSLSHKSLLHKDNTLLQMLSLYR